MVQENQNLPQSQAGPVVTPPDTGYSAEYVKSLRDEAAGWRTKFRELEAGTTQKDVALELAKRGISANPTWVELKEGQTTTQAVDAFLKQYPQLATGDSTQAGPAAQSVVDLPDDLQVGPMSDILARRKVKIAPKAVGQQKTNVDSRAPSTTTLMREGSLEDIKNDPKARAAISDFYQTELRRGAGQ